MPAVNAADIDWGGIARRDQRRNLLDGSARYAERLGEVVAGAGRDYCQSAIGAGSYQRLRDTTAGSVTADDADRRPPFGERLPRETLFVTALSRLLYSGDAKRGEGLRDSLQSSPRGALSSGGVDDQPRGPGQAISADIEPRSGVRSLELRTDSTRSKRQ